MGGHAEHLLWGQGRSQQQGVTGTALGSHKHVLSLVGAVLWAGRRVLGAARCHFSLEKISMHWGCATVNAQGEINGQGVQGGPSGLTGKKRSPLSPSPLPKLLCTEGHQSLTSSSEGHSLCPNSSRGVKTPPFPKRAEVLGSLGSNWDEV